MNKLYSSPFKKLLWLLTFVTIQYQFKAQTVTTFSYTGLVQTFTVPPCVGTLSVDLSGAQGGTAPTYNSIGGLGGRLVAVIPVTAGQVFSVYVGGQNYNGGGTGSTYGGVGGGATDIRTGGSALANRVLVAGGGGGGGTNCFNNTNQGGGGGGTTGDAGFQCSSQTTYVGTGGSQTAGGTSLGSLGTSGALGTGGNGGSTYGGGGGGGYYGGGGGSYGGGGGGSNFAAASASNVTHTMGFRSGNGIATFSYSQNGSGVAVSPVTNTVCSGVTLTLTASSSTSYTWSSNAGGSNAATVAVTPTSNITYSVSGTNTFGCVTTATVNLTVSSGVPSLTVANTASAPVCPGTTVNITGSGANSYSWTGGITNGVAFTPTVSGSYTLSGTNACGTSTAATSLTMATVPSLTIANSSPTICSGNTATLAASGASTYVWIGPTTVTNGLAFFPTTTGDYTVYATTANGCSVTGITSITVVTTPGNFPTSTPTAICLGQTATITVTGATNYTWLPGNVNSSTIAVNPTITTTYTVIKSNANCVDTKTFVLNVNSLPGLSIISSNTIVCANNSLSLQGGGAATYTWAPGGISGQSVVITPSASVVYTLTASNGTCANTATVSITTKANPTISLVPSSSVICNGFCSTLTASGGNSYTWTATPASSSSLTGATVADCPTTTTSYSVAGSNSLGCITGAQQIIVVNPLPSFSVAANPALVCVAANSTISAQSLSGVTYSWSTGASTRTNQVSPLATNVYTCTATFTATQCKDTRTVTVSVFVPTFAITGPTAVCVGGTITINASGSLVANNAYVWSGNGYTSTGFPSFAISPTVPTIYICTGTGTLSGVVCASTKTVLIGIYQNPTVTAVVDRTLICKGETAYLTGGGAATYLWNTNQTGSTVPVSPTANSITYTVVGTDANGCEGTATVQVRTSSCIGINELSLNRTFVVYPNPANGEFTIEADAAMNLQIVDELGREVKVVSIKEINGFESKVNGLSPGVYFIVGEKDNKKIHQKIIIQ